MNAELYIAKHEFIRADLNQIEAAAAAGIDGTSAETIAGTINRLTAVLKMHLASEDTYLYPSLLNSGDEKIRRITERYMSEMGNLSQSYTAFHEAWNTASKILADRSGFIEQFRAVRSALVTRMDREEQELYLF
jgi:hypothetical protein